MTKLICSTCKKDLEPVKDKIDSEYTSYQEKNVACIKCIEIDMRENTNEWNDFGHLWDLHFSDIEKMFYDMDGYTCAPEGTETPEGTMDKTWIEVEKTSFFLSWRIMASVRSWGLPDRLVEHDDESIPEETDAEKESLAKQYDNMVKILGKVVDLEKNKWKSPTLRKDLEVLVKEHHEIMKEWNAIPEKPKEEPETTRALPKELDHSNEIFSFIHCKRCVTEKNGYPDIECGWTKFGFRVMCRTHNQEIVFFPLPPEMIPVGCECPGCQEDLK